MFTIVSKTNTYLKAIPAVNKDVLNRDRVKIYPRRVYKCAVLDTKENYTYVDLGSLGQWWLDTKDWEGFDDRPLCITKPVIESSVGRIHLKVPYFKQKDVHQGGYKSSLYLSCAAALMYLRPGKVINPEEYLEKIQQFGSYDCPYSNVDFLVNSEVTACYRKNGTFADLKSSIDKSYPVICCVLNQGPGNETSGEGHWVNVVGYDENRMHLIVNDPLGKLNHFTGNYETTEGEAVHYTKHFFRQRWSKEGYGSGWLISLCK